MGQRTDILINAFRVGEDGQPLDPISAVIEVKGFWNRELRFALNDQLVQDYMVAARAPIGIFLVGWFDPTDWDPDDSRRNAAYVRALQKHGLSLVDKQARYRTALKFALL